MSDITKNERLLDLVRYMRGELHDADLITDGEYAQLSAISGSPERLMEYDELAGQLASVTKERDALLDLLESSLIHLECRWWDAYYEKSTLVVDVSKDLIAVQDALGSVRIRGRLTGISRDTITRALEGAK